jgi:hypothetical protein
MVPVPIPPPDQGRPKQRPAAHTPGDAARPCGSFRDRSTGEVSIVRNFATVEISEDDHDMGMGQNPGT